MGWFQGVSGVEQLGATTASVTFARPVGYGNCVVVAVWSRDLTYLGTINVTDDKGNSYNLCDQVSDSPTFQASTQTYYLSNIVNAPSTITVTVGATAQIVTIADEYVGITTASDPRDGHSINKATQNTVSPDGNTSGNITTTVAGDVIWSANINWDSLSPDQAPGTGFTLREQTFFGLQTEDKVQPVAGVTAGTWSSFTGNQTLVTAVIALIPAPQYTNILSMSANEC